MTDLDDPGAIRATDPGGMLDAVTSFASHVRQGHALGASASRLPVADDASAIVVCGMGSSAVGGDVLAAIAAPRLHLPVTVVRTSELPEWVGPRTIVVASSYSGETAETLALFEEALVRGGRILVVTSGGTLGARASELDLGRVIVPGGLMPRAALGYMAMGTFGALEAIGVLPSLAEDLDEALLELEGVVGREGPDVPSGSNPAKALALAIGERVPVVWGAGGIGAAAAVRWSTQFNENAKVPSFASMMPELDHNEVVGWAPGRGESFTVIALRHEGESADVAARFEPSMQIAREAGATTQEVWAHGRSPLARLLTLVQTGDLVSTYLGLVRDVDPSPIDAIVRLKAALADA